MNKGTLFITAMPWEAAAVAGDIPGRRVLRTGIGSEHTIAALDRALANSPASELVSTGCAGALVEGLTAGVLIIADGVATREGTRIKTDPELSGRLRTCAATAGIRTVEGWTLASATVVSSPSEKRSLATETGCIAVDMESGVVAKFARNLDIPFAVARVILDPVDTSIPLGLIDPEGRLAPLALAKAIVRPRSLRALFVLRHSKGEAEASLRALYSDGKSRSIPPM